MKVEVKEQETTSAVLTVEHEDLGLCRATLVDDQLTDLRICGTGSSIASEAIYVTSLKKALAMREAMDALMDAVEKKIMARRG